jgi:hypothetical protein
LADSPEYEAARKIGEKYAKYNVLLLKAYSRKTEITD